jgi:hypothetical protein
MSDPKVQTCAEFLNPGISVVSGSLFRRTAKYASALADVPFLYLSVPDAILTRPLPLPSPSRTSSLRGLIARLFGVQDGRPGSAGAGCASVNEEPARAGKYRIPAFSLL